MTHYILGISAYYHDSAATLIENGEIVAAASEERFTRRKFDSRFPKNALLYCLSEASIELDKIDFVVFYEKPLLKFRRLLATYLAFAPRGFSSFKAAMSLWLSQKLFQRREICRHLQRMAPHINWKRRLLFVEHHRSHAASAFFASPFERAAILTMDGVGEWTTTSVSTGNGNRINMIKEMRFPHSPGMLYSAFTGFCGFKILSGEYKLMGLAPYGEPKYVNLIEKHLIDLKQDGSFRLNMDYFDYCTGFQMTNEKFYHLFGLPRLPDEPLTQREMDLAASVQCILEKIVLRMARSAAKETGMRNLCLAGGVALNCVANGKLLKDGGFERIWVQPAAGDAGGSLGAALSVWHEFLGNPRVVQGKADAMKGAYLGPAYSNERIEEHLEKLSASFKRVEEEELLDTVVSTLLEGKAVGWFQGRMEFGPRALGNRSILGDARSTDMQKILNLKVKFRESFRPFAPSILAEHLREYFDIEHDSPYMLFVADVLKRHRMAMTPEQEALFGIERLNVQRSTIPTVTHVDYSARIQSVHRETNPLYHRLITKFWKRTGCPVLVNTSFNVRGEPIVRSPEDAFRCFMGTDLDVLAIGNYLLYKKDQDPALALDYRSTFPRD